MNKLITECPVAPIYDGAKMITSAWFPRPNDLEPSIQRSDPSNATLNHGYRFFEDNARRRLMPQANGLVAVLWELWLERECLTESLAYSRTQTSAYS
jgi:hypothetical protein